MDLLFFFPGDPFFTGEEEEEDDMDNNSSPEEDFGGDERSVIIPPDEFVAVCPEVIVRSALGDTGESTLREGEALVGDTDGEKNGLVKLLSAL